MKLFKQSEVRAGMQWSDYIHAVEGAHRAHGLGQVIAPDLLHADSEHGEFHIKIGGLKGEKTYFGLKANGGFFSKAERHGLPNIIGIIYLCDGDTGMPLAVLDSVAISMYRTGAAAAVAAKYLARPDSRCATICGTGNQARIQIEALLQVLPLETVLVHGRNPQRAEELASQCRDALSLDVRATTDLAAAIAQSDVLVTCTASTEPLIEAEWIGDGMFIAAVGADSPGKQELDPHIVSRKKVVTDILHQATRVGECQHAINAGLLVGDELHAELGEVICGNKPGRESDSETIVFDSTGTALQDVAAAAFLYEKSLAAGTGLDVDLLA